MPAAPHTVVGLVPLHIPDNCPTVVIFLKPDHTGMLSCVLEDNTS